MLHGFFTIFLPSYFILTPVTVSSRASFSRQRPAFRIRSTRHVTPKREHFGPGGDLHGNGGATVQKPTSLSTVLRMAILRFRLKFFGCFRVAGFWSTAIRSMELIAFCRWEYHLPWSFPFQSWFNMLGSKGIRIGSRFLQVSYKLLRSLDLVLLKTIL